jgi:hypothetical protein
MKQMLHFLNILFSLGGFVLLSVQRSGVASIRRIIQIIIALTLFSAIAIAQESPPEEFPVGTAINASIVDVPEIYSKFYEIGLNTVIQRADDTTKIPLEDYNLLAWNSKNPFEYIYHYSSSYYSKWEAEVDAEPDRVGFKHRDSLGYLIGNSATWNGKSCWSSLGLSGPRDSLMYGPDYWQDKKYKRWYPEPYPSWEVPIKYKVRFKMALENRGSVPPDEDVCVIRVIYRYKEVESGIFHIWPFLEQTLKVGDFDTLGNFDLFDFEGATYQYDAQFILPYNVDKLVDPPAGTITYTDKESYTGIQYVVDWLRDDDDCTLYIDYVEVYDNWGWNEYLNPATHDEVIQNIVTYAQNFSGWDNITCWGGMDEPSTLDAYTPVHIVDSLIRSVQAPPLINFFNPSWTWNHLINGEKQMSQYIDIAKPQEFLLAMNPCDDEYPVLTYNQLDWLRYNFQLADSLHPDFWYAAQTHGLLTEDSIWCVWRKPNSSELSAIVMLALAHGAKGIIFQWFDSYGGFPAQDMGHCIGTHWECVVDENGNPEIRNGDTLYAKIKNNLVSRLKGKLGKTLLDLDYKIE